MRTSSPDLAGEPRAGSELEHQVGGERRGAGGELEYRRPPRSADRGAVVQTAASSGRAAVAERPRRRSAAAIGGDMVQTAASTPASTTAAAIGGDVVQTAASSRSAASSGRAAVAELELDQEHAGEHDRGDDRRRRADHGELRAVAGALLVEPASSARVSTSSRRPGRASNGPNTRLAGRPSDV